MKTIIFFVSAFLLISNLNGFAQQKPLAVGDTIPNLKFEQVFDRAKPILQLTDFKDKLVILDFWGVRCSSCLEEFPKLDSLQNVFKDHVQIISVNSNSLGRDSLIRFFKKHPRVHLLQLPSVIGSKVLMDAFPHRGNPYRVWISKDGVLTLDDVPITAEYIQAVLENKKVKFPQPVRNIYPETLFDKRYSSDVIYSSYFYRLGELGVHLEPAANGQSFADAGTIAEMYQRAWEDKGDFFRPGRTVVLTNDSTKFFIPKDHKGYDYQEWMRRNYYSYQITVPENRPFDYHPIFKEDLNRTFGLKVSVEKRPVQCLALIRTSAKDKLKTKGGKQINTFRYLDEKNMIFIDAKRELKNQPFGKIPDLLGALIENILHRPFVDLTGYKGNVDLSFNPAALEGKPQIKLLREALKRYDLDLVEREVEQEVLVLDDTKQK
jgi:uncharacterized protein (TIGR03435 family)